jgi:four helix bundle protein
MHDFHRLHVWKLARELGSDVLRETAKASHPELRMITSQLRRSALSIASIVAEDCGKNSRAETLRYFEIGASSAAETEHHLLVAKDIRVLPASRADDYLTRIASIRRMLCSLNKRLPA